MSAGAHARAGADVSFRDVPIKIPDRGCDQRCEWRHVPEAWAEIWEKSVSWVLPRRKKVDICLLAEPLLRVPHVVWGRWKIQVYLSPYVEKPLNSKVIKGFVSELRSRKCFFLCLGIPMFYIYELWSLYVHFTCPYLAMLQFFKYGFRIK